MIEKQNAETQVALDEYDAFDIEQSPLPQTSFGWLREGIMTPILGFKILMKFKGLFWYFIIPILIQTVISLALIGLFYLMGSLLAGWIEWVVDWLTAKASELAGAEQPVDESGWIRIAIEVVIWAPLILFFMYLFVLVWRVTGGVLTGYFGGRLTDKAIEAAGIEFPKSQETTFIGEVVRSWVHAAAIAIPSTMLIGVSEFIPFIGPIIVVPFVWAYSAYMTGYEELRDPLAKMGDSNLGALRTCWKKKYATFGLGFAKMACEPIPVIGGVVQAAESLGRLSLAIRIKRANESELSPTVKKNDLAVEVNH